MAEERESITGNSPGILFSSDTAHPCDLNPGMQAMLYL